MVDDVVVDLIVDVVVDSDVLVVDMIDDELDEISDGDTSADSSLTVMVVPTFDEVSSCASNPEPVTTSISGVVVVTRRSDSTTLSVTMTIFVSVDKLGMSSSPALDSIS